MSCFWNSLISSISKDDKIKYFDDHKIHLNPKNLVVILKNLDIKTPNIIWNSKDLTEKQMIENYNAIKEYDINSIQSGYYCSTFEPFLFLLAEYLEIDIFHNYNGNIMHYKNKNNCRYSIKIRSNLGHCWKE